MRHKDQRGCSGPPSSVAKVRKASYYVWFLGAEECRGLRGADCVRPVVHYLVGREREQEPDKVTLQVSGRGIKLLQAGTHGRSTAPVKHFIPASAVTFVQQEARPDDDIVSAILLIYNPLTRCPVHVHTYRCDSTETASLLREHLAQLVDHPEQQAKLAALESRLAARGLLPPPPSTRGSDGASTGSSTSSGGGGSSSGRSPTAVPAATGPGMSTLYDSLAAELREKLGSRGAPLLLPPKDYDTLNRSRGRLPDARRAPPAAARKSQEDDSARSSGIGSDDAPSPTHDRDLDPIDNQSSSDEEWERHVATEVRGEAGLILVQPSWRGRDPPAHGQGHPPPTRAAHRSATHHQVYVGRSQSPTRGRARAPHNSPPGARHPSPTRVPRDLSPIRPVHQKRTPPRPHAHTRDRSESPVSPRERFQDARDKFRSLERDWQRPDRPDCQARPHAHGGVCRTPSWEPNPKGGSGVREARGSVEQGGRDEGVWPKSDRDTGYGSRDGLLRERPRGRDFDRGYGTCDTRDSDPWRREVGHRTPDPWQREPRAPSPTRAPRGRSPTREYRVPRVRSPDRTDYHRAKSMHDLSQRRAANENEEDRGGCNDPRRRSMYDTAEDPRPLRESRTNRHYRSQASLRRHNSCSSDSCHSADSYNELPETRRFPGLDRATARPDPLEHARGHPHTAHLNSKRTFDYPVNGGTAAVHISRAQHDDYRRFRYDHTTTPQFIRSTSVPTTHY
ncbi:serine/arginine repetitive matrix protein 1-like isoform X2 [Homarus americanus]|uniref:serine/arginine repetitive matrix protein 1-like isoform X2 n=1 Tax=Homarus americanus TaxID=6706 RepID=UPI001C44F031|nr:serine/arginine repetitive matrix protein 1-like isoform X2 [Homarus americanus]